MQKRDYPFLDTAFSNLGSAAGSLIAGATLGGAFLGPSGIIAGTAVGALVGHGIARYAPFPRNLERRLRQYIAARNLFHQKFDQDIQQAFLLDRTLFENEMKDLRARLDSARVVDGTRDRRLPNDEEWRLFDSQVEDSALAQDIQLLRACNIIKINVSSINVATIAALTSMKSRFDIPISLHASDINGREQIRTLVNSGDDYDFFVVPIDPFFLGEFEKTARYALIGPVNGEDQYIFRRRAKAFNRFTRVWAFAAAAPEMHYRLGTGVPRNSEIEPIDDARKIPALLDSVAGGDYIIAWDPLSHLLVKNSKFEIVPGSRHCVTFCLFCNRRWRHPKHTRLREAFKRVFQNEWWYCKNNRRKVLRAIRKDAALMQRFAEGCGLTWTSEIP